jgi:chorismate mutase
MKPWFYNKQSITEFKEPVVYKGLNISVSKTKVKPPYIAVVTSPATSKEVLRTGGNTEQEALDSAKQAVDKREADAPKISASGQTSILFNTPSNDELLKDPTMYNHIYAKISKDQNGPTLVIGNEIYGAADLEADGFRRSDRRNPEKAGEDALPQVAVNASNKVLSQMGIKMNGRYTMDIEGKYEDDKGHTVYPLQFQSSTLHAGDKERMKRPGLTIGMKRKGAQPWFQREFEEAEIIKFPEPVKNVVELPNVQSYPDFLTGVKDLHNRRDRGEISQDSHDKLYADLIQRFMKKESFENPWFLREDPQEEEKIKQRVIRALNKKRADDPMFDKIYRTIIGKALGTRIENYIAAHQDTDIGTEEMAFLVKEIPTLGTTQEVKNFVLAWNKGNDFINTQELIPTEGMTEPKPLISVVGEGLPQKLFQTLTRQNFSKSDGGPGEAALAIMSPVIKYTGSTTGGDVIIDKKRIEVKGGGKSASSGGGRVIDDKWKPNWGPTTAVLQKAGFKGNISVLRATKPFPPNFPKEDFIKETCLNWFGQEVKSLIDTFGTPQFRLEWNKVIFNSYKAKAKHEGILIIGRENYQYIVNGEQLANTRQTSKGTIYYPASNQTRDLGIQVSIG